MARRRTPSPEEADLLSVYLDAERYLLETVRDEVTAVADAHPDNTDARRVQGMNRVRQAAERTVYGLERGSADRIDRVITAAAEEGADAAAAQLSAITGRGRHTHDDQINRGALDRLAAATADRVSLAHTAILRTVPDAYRVAVARTVPGVLVGAQSTREAAQRAMWALTDQGITGFVDRAGRRWRLSSYVEMATRTAAARAMVDAQLDRLAASGFDLVQVGAVPRPCPRCSPWESRVLAHAGGPIGNVEVPDAITGDPVSVSVAATVDQARAAGLLHPNCRHSLSIYLAGVTKPVRVWPNRDGYRAAQRQREIERHIRAWKERQAVALDTAAARYAAGKVRAWQGEMRHHLKTHPDLKRLPYREGVGAGHTPTAGLKHRVGRSGPTPTQVVGKTRAPRQMSSHELERRMQAALAAEDYQRFEKLAAESDRRDLARQAATARRKARAEQRDARRLADYERLVAAGVDDESAVEQVYGITIERQRRQAAISRLRDGGYEGRTLDELARQAYRDHVYEHYRRAEDELGTAMLTREAKQAGIDERSLFTGPETRARRWASDELKEWWDVNGRPTYPEFRADLLGDTGTARNLRSQRGDFWT